MLILAILKVNPWIVMNKKSSKCFFFELEANAQPVKHLLGGWVLKNA